MECDSLAPLRGGNLNNGANAGPFYWNCNNSAANANWNIGCRPTFSYVNTLPMHSMFHAAWRKFGPQMARFSIQCGGRTVRAKKKDTI